MKINISWLKQFLFKKEKQLDSYEHGFKVVKQSRKCFLTK